MAMRGPAPDWSEAIERRLLGGTPLLWFALLAAGAPWVRLNLGEVVLYPLHLAVGVAGLALWLPLWWRERHPLPLKGLWWLVGWLLLLLLLRGEWWRAGTLAAAVAVNAGWALWVHRLGGAGARGAELLDGLVWFLVGCLAVEGLTWLLALFWPWPCEVLRCPAWPRDPPVFAGGMTSPAQFALLLALVLPALATPLVLAWRTPQARPQRIVLTGLGAALGMGALAGAGWWLVPFALVLWLGLLRTLLPWGDARDRSLLRALAIWMVVVPVLFYAVFPAYLMQWSAGTGADDGRGRVRVVPVESLPRALSSLRDTPLALDVTNQGGVALPAGSRLVPQLFLSPRRGGTRVHDLPATALETPLPPHETRRLTVPVRLPPWVAGGFLGWELRSGAGPAVLSDDSHVGWRVVNADHDALLATDTNRLSALARRAREFAAETRPASRQRGGETGWEHILGELLDTLFFSPVWGEQKPVRAGAGRVFPPERLFLPHLFAEFGLIGLALVLRLGWVTARRADRVGLRAPGTANRLTWHLVPVSLMLVGVLALFSSVTATYHAVWGLFLLIAFVEGRCDRLFPPRPAQPLPGVAWLRALLQRRPQLRRPRPRPRRGRRIRRR